MLAVVLGDPAPGSVGLLDVGPETFTSVELLGYGTVTWEQDGTDLIVELPPSAEIRVAYTLALSR